MLTVDIQYPNGDNGAYLKIQNPNAGYFILLDPANCESTIFTDDGDPADATFVCRCRPAPITK